jgi:ABC-type multidrug transport system fused ATPase/permease subunit
MVNTVKLLFRLTSPGLRRKFLFVEGLALLSALVDTLAFGSLYPLLEVLTSYNTSRNSLPIRIARDVYGVQTQGQLEIRIGLTIVGIFIVSSVVGLILTWKQAAFAAKMEEDVAIHMFQEYMEVPYLDHVSSNSSDQVRNTQVLPSEISQNGILSIILLTQNVLVILFLVILIAVVSPVAVLGSVIYFGFAILMFFRVISPRSLRAGRASVPAAGACIRIIQEGFGGLKAFRSANATRTVSRAFNIKRHEYAQLRFRLILYSQLPQYYLQSAMIGGVVLFVAIVAFTHTRNQTDLIGIVIAAFIRLFPALYQVLNCTSKLRNSQGAIEELYGASLRMTRQGDLSRQGRRKGVLTRSAIQVEKAPEKIEWANAIIFNDVSFNYPNSAKYALQQVTFSISRGAFVGIVGPSGAGKTTIVDMILGLFLPDSGSIRLDDRDLTAADIPAWRKLVGYVPQDVFLLDASVRENIGFGEEINEIDDDRVWEALHRAQLGEEISSIQAGLNTTLGERGVRLSGGQRQRIGIARALYRNPEVLVLDEATSSLDVVTEAAVTKTIEDLGGDLTRIVVAHRLSTVRSCNQLLLMNNGRVEGHGDFSSLRSNNAFFRNMADLARID